MDGLLPSMLTNIGKEDFPSTDMQMFRRIGILLAEMGTRLKAIVG